MSEIIGRIDTIGPQESVSSTISFPNGCQPDKCKLMAVWDRVGML